MSGSKGPEGPQAERVERMRKVEFRGRPGRGLRGLRTHLPPRTALQWGEERTEPVSGVTLGLAGPPRKRQLWG